MDNFYILWNIAKFIINDLSVRIIRFGRDIYWLPSSNLSLTWDRNN